jgi:hypothetical protein
VINGNEERKEERKKERKKERFVFSLAGRNDVSV